MIKLRQFGNTSDTISELSYGCGGFWGLPIFSEQESAALLSFALESGVNFLDTGANYSRGNAELRLGRFLQNNPEHTSIKIATKAGSRLLNSGKVVRDFSYQGIIDSVYDSLKRLQLDRIFLLQLHSPTQEALNSTELEDALSLLQERQLVKYVGASADGNIARQIAESSYFDSLMITYNIVTKESLKTIETAHKNGKAVLIKSPLSHNVVGKNFFKLNSIKNIWYFLRVIKNYRSKLSQRNKYTFLNHIPEWSASQIAIRYLLDHSQITSLVIGSCNMDHLNENINCSTRSGLSPELFEKIKAI